MAKKATGIESVPYAEAVELALCFGWIDGRREGHDETFFLQRFTPRRPRSRWSRINRDKAELMTGKAPFGRPASPRSSGARDGRWEAAYEGQRATRSPRICSANSTRARPRRSSSPPSTARTATRSSTAWTTRGGRKPAPAGSRVRRHARARREAPGDRPAQDRDGRGPGSPSSGSRDRSR